MTMVQFLYTMVVVVGLTVLVDSIFFNLKYTTEMKDLIYRKVRDLLDRF